MLRLSAGKAEKLLKELKMVRNPPSLVKMVAEQRAEVVNWKSLYNVRPTLPGVSIFLGG